MPQRVIEVVIRGDNQAAGSLKGFKDLLGSIGSAASAPQKALAGLADTTFKLGMMATGIAGLAGAAQAAGKAIGVDFNAKMEQARIGFTTLMGGSDAAQKHLAELMQFAKTTPFDQESLISASQRLQAMGFRAEQVVPTLTAVGNAVAALGGTSATVDRVTTALGQMRAKGKVSAEEMMQLTEAGIPAWELLAKSIGVSIPEAMKMAEKGTIASDRAISGILDGMNSRFGGMMAAQSRTFQGAMSTIKDSLNIAVGTAFEPFFGLLSEGAVTMADFLSSDEFATWGSRVNQAVGSVVGEVRGFIRTVQNIGRDHGLSLFDSALVATELRIRDAFGPRAGDLFNGFIGLSRTLGTQVGEAFTRLSSGVSAVATIIQRAMAGDLSGALRSFEELNRRVTATVTTNWGAVGDLMQARASLIGASVRGLASAIETHSGALQAAWSRAWAAVDSIATAAVNKLAPLVTDKMQYITSWVSSNLPLIERTFDTVFSGIARLVTGTLNTMATFWAAHGDRISDVVGRMVDLVDGLFSTALANILDTVKVGMQLVTGDFSGAAATIRGIFVRLFDGMMDAAQTFFGLWGSWLQMVDGLTGGVFSSLAGKVMEAVNAVGTAFGSLVAAATPIVAGIMQPFDEIAAWFTTQYARFDALATQIGTNIWSGLITGITAGIGNVASAAYKLGAQALTSIRQAVDAHSDSVEAIGIGEDVGNGLVTGLENTAQAVEDTMAALGAAMLATFTASVTPIEKENEEHGERLEAATRKHARRLADLQADLAAAKPAQRKAILDRIQDEETKHARAVEDLTDRHADNLIDAEMRMARERGAAIQEFLRDSAAAANDAAGKIEALNARAGKAMADAMREAEKDIEEARTRAVEQIAQAQQQIADSRAQRSVRQTFEGEQDVEARNRQNRMDAADLERRITQETAKLKASYDEDTSELKRRRELEDADRLYALEKDLAERRYQTRLDLEDATTDEEREAIQERARDEDNAIRHRYTLASDDLRRRRTLEDTERAYRLTKAQGELAARQAEARAELVARQQAATEERTFREQQQSARQSFEDGLENTALAATLTRAGTERDARITAIRAALATKMEALTEDARVERDLIQSQLNQRLTDLRERFVSKVGPLTEEAATIINGFLDGTNGRITNLIAASMTAASALASLITGSTALTGAWGLNVFGDPNFQMGGTTPDPDYDTGGDTSGGPSSFTTPIDDDPVGNPQLTDDDILGQITSSYATGTLRVPGKPGEARLVEAHGGERISSWTGSNDDQPLVIMLDGDVIFRSTWRRLKERNLTGTNLAVT